MKTESQLIVSHFAQKHNHKFIGKVFSIQIGLAKKLLEEYSYDDLVLVIDYTAVFPEKRITSLAFYPYIINEVLPKAKAWKVREEQKKVVLFTNEKLVKTENKSLSKKKMFRGGKF